MKQGYVVGTADNITLFFLELVQDSLPLAKTG
jgi:hypothetical protein